MRSRKSIAFVLHMCKTLSVFAVFYVQVPTSSFRLIIIIRQTSAQFIFHLPWGVKPITELIIEQFPLHYDKEKRFFWDVTCYKQWHYIVSFIQGAQQTRLQVQTWVFHGLLFASLVPVFPLLNFFRVNTIFCLFIQNATQQSTRGASKKSLASAPARRPTVGTLWWAKLMFNISAKISPKFWGFDLFFSSAGYVTILCLYVIQFYGYWLI